MDGFLKGILRFLFGLFAPVLLIAAGAGVVGLGTTYSLTFLIWTGIALIGAGVLWGAFLFFAYGSVD